MASSRQIHVTITADADPAIRELRRAENAVKRLRAQYEPTDADRRFWAVFRAGQEFERTLQRVRAIFESKPDERKTDV